MKMLRTINPGLFWQFLGMVCFCAVMTINRTLGPYVAKEVILFGRCLFSLFFLAPFFQLQGLFFLWPMLVLRGVLTAATMYCTYSAYRHVPTATMALFGTVTPLLTSFFSATLLGEKMKRLSLFALVLGMVGVGVVYWDQGIHSLFSTLGYAPLSSVMCALSSVCGRWLVKKGAQPHSLLFYNITIPLGASFFLAQSQFSLGIFAYWKILFLVGLLGGLGQYCHIKTMQNIRLSLSAPLEYVRPFILIPIGFFYFGDVPKISFYWGACFVFLSALMAWSAILKEKKQAA